MGPSGPPVIGSVSPGQIWQHWKGSTYKVIAIALLESTKEPHVVYRRVDMVNEHTLVVRDEAMWLRPVAEWFDLVPAGVQRFTKIRDFP